jgi:hypothetical protein
MMIPLSAISSDLMMIPLSAISSDLQSWALWVPGGGIPGRNPGGGIPGRNPGKEYYWRGTPGKSHKRINSLPLQREIQSAKSGWKRMVKSLEEGGGEGNVNVRTRKT